MSTSSYDPSADPEMHILFQQEVELHSKSLTEGLLKLENSSDDMKITEQLMRAAHSIKGAAKMVGVDAVVSISHVMEDCFVAAQNNTISLSANDIDVLLKSIDTIVDISNGKKDDFTEKAIKDLTEQIRDIKYNALQKTIPTKTSNDNSTISSFQLGAINIYEKIKYILESCTDTEPSHEDTDSLLINIIEIRNSAKLCGLNSISKLCSAIEKRISLELNSDGDISLAISSDIAVALNAVDIAIKSSAKDDSNTHLIEIANMLAKPASVLNVGKVITSNTLNPTPNIQTSTDQTIKISTQRLNKLIGLAGESVVESRWVRSHIDTMQTYKRRQSEITSALDRLRGYIDEIDVAEHISELLNDIQKRANDARSYLGVRLSELDDYDRRATGLSKRLNTEILQTRMRPFSDCTHGFNRIVRDLARSFKKDIHLKIIGENTQVDREILNRIEAPLNHIIRNAIDHGIETPAERSKNGKNKIAVIQIEASHNMGMLSISISDDGHGVDMQVLRNRILEKNLSNKQMITNLTNSELLDFLYLPGFTTRNNITEISGRGVGLDVVHNTIQEMHGKIRTTSVHGQGMQIQLLLPLTLSVIRSLLVKIGGQAYAFPLARIDSCHTLTHEQIETLEGKQYFTLNDKHIGLIEASQVLQIYNAPRNNDEIPVIILGDRNSRYGLVVEKFIGERDITVNALDPRLGKIRDISAATILEDGSPALIIDIEDIIRSIEILLSGERLSKINSHVDLSSQSIIKHVLVVDDSITVREVEKKLLESHGYHVDVAVDGMDAWNTVRTTTYDLIISDVDMPRMNGIEFVKMLKSDSKFKNIPIMIVSYKDREEDRDAGLEAGADYYLTKGSFHDESLIDAVIDLIGPAS